MYPYVCIVHFVALIMCNLFFASAEMDRGPRECPVADGC